MDPTDCVEKLYMDKYIVCRNTEADDFFKIPFLFLFCPTKILLDSFSTLKSSSSRYGVKNHTFLGFLYI